MNEELYILFENYLTNQLSEKKLTLKINFKTMLLFVKSLEFIKIGQII